MKTAGLLGGMSWESTALYYQLINRGVKARIGGLSSAQIALYSVNFHDIEPLQKAGDWAGAGALLASAAQKVEAAGADFLLICTNTMHRVYDDIARGVSIPVLHIADATGAALKARGVSRVGLLGTRFTMEQAFYRARLVDRYGIEVLVPEEDQRSIVHDIIYGELCLGQIREHSRAAYLRIIDDLAHAGAEAVILGCTEIGMLVEQQHTDVPLLDTTRIHADTAVDWML